MVLFYCGKITVVHDFHWLILYDNILMIIHLEFVYFNSNITYIKERLVGHAIFILKLVKKYCTEPIQIRLLTIGEIQNSEIGRVWAHRAVDLQV